MEKEKINIIKIVNKNKWIDSFCQKVEKIGENEDYLKTNYMADREIKNKFCLAELKELKEFKFNIIIVGFLIIMFFVGNFREEIFSLVIIMLFFIIVNFISRKKEKGYISNRKKILKKLMEIEPKG